MGSVIDRTAACTLCPRKCGADRLGKPGGFCRLPDTMQIARIAPHYWEEPPISGRRGTGAVFFSGCNLRCVYCQNRSISHTGIGRSFTPDRLADALIRLASQGAETLSFITGTPFVPEVIETMRLYREKGGRRLPVVWNTSGYETVETLRLLEGTVDIYLPDFKHISEHAGRICAGAPDYAERIGPALTEMVRQTGSPVYDDNGILQHGTVIRHLILPGLTSESIEILNWIRDHLPEDTPVSLMRQYTPPAEPIPGLPGFSRRITDREYRRVKKHMELLGLSGFLQDAASADAAYTPPFNEWDEWDETDKAETGTR